MSLGTNRETAENKLILLYFINKINISVSNLQITKIILEHNLMSYILLQQFLDELCENNLLKCSIVDNKSYYEITQAGKQTLDYFHNLIPKTIVDEIDRSTSQIKQNIRNETSITADFTPVSENEYIVECKVHEDNYCLIDLKVTVGTKSDARLICNNWKNSSQTIYQEIISSLIKDRS